MTENSCNSENVILSQRNRNWEKLLKTVACMYMYIVYWNISPMSTAECTSSVETTHSFTWAYPCVNCKIQDPEEGNELWIVSHFYGVHENWGWFFLFTSQLPGGRAGWTEKSWVSGKLSDPYVLHARILNLIQLHRKITFWLFFYLVCFSPCNVHLISHATF